MLASMTRSRARLPNRPRTRARSPAQNHGTWSAVPIFDRIRCLQAMTGIGRYFHSWGRTNSSRATSGTAFSFLMRATWPDRHATTYRILTATQGRTYRCSGHPRARGRYSSAAANSVFFRISARVATLSSRVITMATALPTAPFFVPLPARGG